MKITRITINGMNAVEKWCKDTDADFLRQWTGRNYTYPITVMKIKEKLSGGSDIFQFEHEGHIIGTIEILEKNYETRSAYVGCFLIDPALHGKGLGTLALQSLKSLLKQNGFEQITLCVFDFNKGALRCYEKAGFTTYDKQDRGDCYAVYMRAQL